MPDLALPAASPQLVRGGLARATACLCLLVALGDWLCFNEFTGVNIALLALSILAASALAAAERPTRRRLITAAFTGIMAQLPWLFSPGLLSFCFCLFGLAFAAAMLTAGPAPRWRQARAMLGAMLWRIVPDFWSALLRQPNFLDRQLKGRATHILGWMVPALGGAVFITLFAAANPVISAGLVMINPLSELQDISVSRIWFWLMLAGLIWPFVHPPAPRAATSVKPPARNALSGLLFGTVPISRALILFNALFALQTGLDATYLLGGAKLPSGLTYADYAHRGAYPLIFTALLAGLFAILATRPGTPHAASRRIRWLLLAWIAQNLALVAAAMLRLYLYVQVYSLTELRLASFIWMLVVFAGLVLILVRILLARSDAWLLGANVGSALAVLYVALCLNFPWIVAQYDVTHCYEVTGSGADLDLGYLQELGPQTIPALDKYQLLTAKTEPAPFVPLGEAGKLRSLLADDFLSEPTDWRGFSVWDWVLHAYMVTHTPKHRDA